MEGQAGPTKARTGDRGHPRRGVTSSEGGRGSSRKQTRIVQRRTRKCQKSTKDREVRNSGKRTKINKKRKNSGACQIKSIETGGDMRLTGRHRHRLKKKSSGPSKERNSLQTPKKKKHTNHKTKSKEKKKKKKKKQEKATPKKKKQKQKEGRTRGGGGGGGGGGEQK